MHAHAPATDLLPASALQQYCKSCNTANRKYTVGDIAFPRRHFMIEQGALRAGRDLLIGLISAGEIKNS